MIGTRQQLAKVNVTSIRVGNHLITKSRSVRNLGTWFNDTFDMSQHVTNLCSASFFQLHNIRRIRKYLMQEAAATLVHSFVTCRIDYCNSLLYGLPDYQLSKLQRVQNSAARLVYKESKFCHITPLLMKLHWLPIIYRIRFKIALLTYKAISGLAYISDLISIKTGANYSLRSGNELLLNFPLRKSYSTLGDRSFSMAAPHVWNSLPSFIRKATTMCSSRKYPYPPPRMVLPIRPPHPLGISVPEGSCITPPPPRNFLFSFSWPYIAAFRDFRPCTAYN